MPGCCAVSRRLQSHGLSASLQHQFLFRLRREGSSSLLGSLAPEGCPRYGVPGGDCSWDEPHFHSEDDDDSDDSSDTDTEMSSDEDEDEEQRAVTSVEQLMEIFEEAADAERV